LQHADYAAAYEQFSSGLQQRITQRLFASFFPNVTACTYSSPTVSGTGTTSTINITAGGLSENDPIQLIQDTTNSWKIDTINNLSTPTKSLQAFCNGLASHDYQSAYDQVSDGYKQKNNYTFDQFQAGYSNWNGHGAVTECAVLNVRIISSSASEGYISYRVEDGAAGTYRYTLDDENGLWKITQQYSA
jgi:hypothetical protein